MLKADFHIHSNVSDGSDSVESLIAAGIKAGLDAIAITDHDTLAHKRQIPEHAPIQVLAGIEISAIDPKTGIKAHILGYQIQDDGLVEALTLPTLEKRHENSLKQIELLKKQGYQIDPDTLNKANGTYIYKQHIVEQLHQTGQITDRFGQFYKDTFKNGGICDFDIQYISVLDAVSAITQAGGMAVLAHSGQQKNFYLIDKLAQMGLCGLEYQHPENTIEDKKIILDFANKHHLFLTGGSDYHGTNAKVCHPVGAFQSEESGGLALCPGSSL